MTATAEVGTRRPPGPLPAPDGWVVGVVGGTDPGGELRRAGLDVAFADDGVALAGTVTVADRVVVGGRIVVDGPPPAVEAQGTVRLPGPAVGLAGARRLADAWLGGGAAAMMASDAMFGAVVHDRALGVTMLVRDPLGERNLYHTAPTLAGRIWFADRPATLRTLGVAGRELDLEALRNYLLVGYVPGTATMLADVREVAPGTAITITAHPAGHGPPTVTFDRLWQPVEGHDDRPFEEWAVTLRNLLVEAVDRRRPPGDVGVYLSGGVDSSTVAALLCRADPAPVTTFAVHFGRDLPNELAFADQVVDRIRPGTHVEIELTSRELAAALPATMAALDDPIGDPLTVPNLALGRRAAERVGTVFNGEGGDPVFGGPKNQPMLLAALYGAGPRSDGLDRLYLRSHQKCAGDLDRLLRPDVRAALVDAPPPEAIVAPYLSAGAMGRFVNRLYEANTRLKGCDHILTKVANLTAAAGLIGRSPLFDRRVVDAAFAMAPEHKLAGTNEKAVLKAAVADLLPPAVIERPKAGMRVPVQTWFRGPLRREGARRLLSRRARIGPYLDRSTIKAWTRYDGDPRGRYGRKLWLLLSLEHWLDVHDIG